jgi:hypothetical protein
MAWRCREAAGTNEQTLTHQNRRLSKIGSVHLGPDLLAQQVDRDQLAVAAEMPVGPAVAGGRALQRGADLMDRAPMLGRRSACRRRAPWPPARAGETSTSPGRSSPRSTSTPKGTRGSARFEAGDLQRPASAGAPAQPRLGQRAIGRLALDPDEVAAQHLGHRAGGAGAEERVQHHVAGIGGPTSTRCSSASGFCVGMRLVAAASFSRSCPVQIGSTQSDRICTPSFSAFSAS